MTKLPINYNNSVIYKIVCNDLNIKDIYVGSTTNFTMRKSQHKHHCNNPNSKDYNLLIYICIRENNGWNNWSMIMIEPFSCENKLELLKQERYWIEELKANLNGQIPTRTKKEYWIDNKKILNQKQNDYYYNNKKILNQKQKEYRDNNKIIISQKRKIKTICACGSEYRILDKSQHEKSKKHIDFINSQSKE